MAKKHRSPKQSPKVDPKPDPEPQRSTLIPWLIVIVAIIVIGFLIARNFIQRTEPQAYARPAAPATASLPDFNGRA